MLGSSIVTDPEDASNHVLCTWQHDAEWHSGGFGSRVQAEFSNYDSPELYYKVKFRLGEDIAVLNGSDWRIWCMLGIELRPKDDPSGGSLLVRIRKNKSDAQLTRGVHRKNPTEGSRRDS